MRTPPSTVRRENLRPVILLTAEVSPLPIFGVKNESPTSMVRHGYLLGFPCRAIFGRSIPFSISYISPLGLGGVGLLLADRLGGQNHHRVERRCPRVHALRLPVRLDQGQQGRIDAEPIVGRIVARHSVDLENGGVPLVVRSVPRWGAHCQAKSSSAHRVRAPVGLHCRPSWMILLMSACRRRQRRTSASLPSPLAE